MCTLSTPKSFARCASGPARRPIIPFKQISDCSGSPTAGLPLSKSLVCS